MLEPYGNRGVSNFVRRNPIKVYGSVLAGGAAVAAGLYNKYSTPKSDQSVGTYKARPAGSRRVTLKSYAKKKRFKRKVKKIKRRNPAIRDLTRKLRMVNNKASQSDGQLTYRLSSVGVVSAAQSLVSSTDFDMNNTSTLDTAIAQLRFYDSSTATYVTANPATSGKFASVHCASMHAKAKFRNNYQTPCYLSLYWCRSKQDTNTPPSTCLSSWATDNLVAGAITDTQVYITDSELFTDLWSIQKHEKVCLEPGQSVVVNYNTKPFDYDPALYDSHSLLYQKKFESCVLFVRLHGELGHDTGAAEYGLLQAAVDYQLHRTWKFVYDAGINCKFVYSSQTAYDAAWTANGVCSNKPVSDNQAYSVS